MAAVAMAIIAPILSGCQGGQTRGPSTDSSPGTTVSQYELSGAGFQACLRDKGVAFRIGNDGSLIIVNPGEDPTIVEATDFCSNATTKPATEEGTAYDNSLTLALADCLEEKGYHVTRSGDDGLQDDAGRIVTTFKVAEAEQETLAYKADSESCFADAQRSVPSPSA